MTANIVDDGPYDAPITITSTPFATSLHIDNGDSDILAVTLIVDHIIAYRDAGNDKTSVWCIGQSAVDGGFLIDVDYDTFTDYMDEALRQRALQKHMMDNGEYAATDGNGGTEQGYEILSEIALRKYQS